MSREFPDSRGDRIRTGLVGCGRSPARTGLRSKFPANREKYREKLTKRASQAAVEIKKSSIFRRYLQSEAFFKARITGKEICDNRERAENNREPKAPRGVDLG